MKILRLAIKSLRNRWGTVALTVFSIAFSVSLLLGVEKIRGDAKQSFTDTISGTDLIIGARSGNVQLMLYSIFHIGNATSNISWESYEKIKALPSVSWTVPLVFGDSYHGFRVVGTSLDYFQYYRYANRRILEFQEGRAFSDIFDAVIGSDIARKFNLSVGDDIELTHGIGHVGFAHHEDKPFRVTGILAKTGTPVDRTVLVNLKGIEAIHVDWIGGAQLPGDSVSAEEVRHMHLEPESITAFLVGLKSRGAILGVQRMVNTYKEEPLLAIIPGPTLQELWDVMGTVEIALIAISVLVVAGGLLGMMTVILAGLNERRREMAILRSVGARPVHIFGLLVLESGSLALLGAIVGNIMLYGALFIARPLIESRWGLFIPITLPTAWDLMIFVSVILAGLIVGFVPGYIAYKNSLADGMMVRT